MDSCSFRGRLILLAALVSALAGCDLRPPRPLAGVDAGHGATARQGNGPAPGQPGLLPWPGQRQALLEQALGERLARTLEAVDGVLQARVHLALGRRVPLLDLQRATPEAPRASVLLVLRAAAGDASPMSAAEVRRLVAGGVQGMKPEQVSVVLKVAAPTATPSPTTVALGPFQVSPASRPALLAALCAGLALIILLGLIAIYGLRRGPAVAGGQGAPGHGEVDTELDLDLESSVSLLSKSIRRKG